VGSLQTRGAQVQMSSLMAAADLKRTNSRWEKPGIFHVAADRITDVFWVNYHGLQNERPSPVKNVEFANIGDGIQRIGKRRSVGSSLALFPIANREGTFAIAGEIGHHDGVSALAEESDQSIIGIDGQFAQRDLQE